MAESGGLSASPAARTGALSADAEEMGGGWFLEHYEPARGRSAITAHTLGAVSERHAAPIHLVAREQVRWVRLVKPLWLAYPEGLPSAVRVHLRLGGAQHADQKLRLDWVATLRPNSKGKLTMGDLLIRGESLAPGAAEHICDVKLARHGQQSPDQIAIQISGGPGELTFVSLTIVPLRRPLQRPKARQSAPPPAPSVSVPQLSGIEGRLDRVTEKGIVGWAWNRNAPATRLTVEILDGGVVVERILAAGNRADLALVGKGDGRHGFRVPLAPGIRDGRTHTITARVEGTNTELAPGAIVYRANPERPYQNWEEYLRWSIHHREINYPDQEPDKRVLGYMDRQRTLRRERYATLPQREKISVVMPMFNRESVVLDAIRSVIAQSYTNWELLIVDDGSSDDSVSVVLGAGLDDRVRLLRLPENKGVSAARNRALAEATGALITYLDSDNAWHEDFLLIMLNSMAEQPGVHSAYCAQWVSQLHSDPGVETDHRAIRFGPFHRALLENRNYIDLNAFVHRRELYDRLGGFNESMRRLVDWDLILRYTAECPPLAVPCCLSRYFYGRVSNQVTDVEASAHPEQCVRAALAEGAFWLPLEAETVVRAATHPEYLFFGVASQARVAEATRARRVAIVIVSYEAGQYLEYCLQSVFAFTAPGTFEVIVVDNASSGDALDVLTHYERTRNVRVVRNDANVGFTLASNQGIQFASAEADIVLLNNDAVVTRGWIEALQEPLDVLVDVGVVVPRQTLLPQTRTMEAHAPYALRSREVDVNLSVHHRNVLDAELCGSRGYVELGFAPFFCAYITRECLNKTGMLDAENGRHYRSDRLYCDMVRNHAKMKIVYTPHSKLYHFLQQSTAELRKSDAEGYQQMFVKNEWTPEEMEKAQAALDQGKRQEQKG